MAMPNIEDSLYHFLEEHGNNRIKRELILFWGMHPNARFNREVICYALDYHKLEMEIALKALAKEGLLDKHIYNGITLYSLTTDQEIRRPVLELTTLGWDRWQLMLMRMEQRDKETNLKK